MRFEKTPMKIRTSLRLRTAGSGSSMKGVGGPFDIIANLLTLLLGFILIAIGSYNITIIPIFALIIGIIIVILGFVSLIA